MLDCYSCTHWEQPAHFTHSDRPQAPHTHLLWRRPAPERADCIAVVVRGCCRRAARAQRYQKWGWACTELACADYQQIPDTHSQCRYSQPSTKCARMMSHAANVSVGVPRRERGVAAVARPGAWPSARLASKNFADGRDVGRHHPSLRDEHPRAIIHVQ